VNAFFVYILASRSRRLYVGVTNNIFERLAEHRNGKVAFTAKYAINRLVYVEQASRPMDAISREKQIKGWVRSKKVALIHAANPTWDDLAADWNHGAE
jgi:putative endonuclease